MIESVRTPEPRVQGQGISPDCDFASRPATKGQSATSSSNESHTRSETRQRASHSLITRQDKRTRDALFTRAPPNNKDTRIQQRSATMFAVFLLCVQARNCSRSNQTMGCAHMDVTSCDVTSATTQSSSVRVCTSAV